MNAIKLLFTNPENLYRAGREAMKRGDHVAAEHHFEHAVTRASWLGPETILVGACNGLIECYAAQKVASLAQKPFADRLVKVLERLARRHPEIAGVAARFKKELVADLLSRVSADSKKLADV
jgi:hypothetical protein